METPDTFIDMFWGYTILWAFVVGYLIRLGCRLGRIESLSSDE